MALPMLPSSIVSGAVVSSAMVSSTAYVAVVPRAARRTHVSQLDETVYGEQHLARG